MRLLIALLTVLVPTLVLADGSYFVSGSETPEIPFQRAIVAYKDGLQRMVIDNSVTAPEKELSWVLPVPARPVQMAPASEARYMFTLAERSYHPIVQGDKGDSPRWLMVLGIALPLLWIGISMPFRYPKLKSPGKTLVRETFAAAIFGLFVFYAFGQSFIGSRAAADTAGGGVSVETEDVGSYRVDIVKGGSAQPIMDWLKANGTPLTSRAKPIVEEYARKGWAFLAAKLKADPGVEVMPHPIVLSFKTEKPLYPMKLTGLVPKPLVLDLFVIADGTAAVEGLTKWVSFKTEGGQDENFDKPAKEYYDIHQLSWDGAVVTRFRTEVPPEQMTRDFEIGIRPYERYQAEVWKRDKLDEEARQRGVLGLGFGALLAAILGTALRLKKTPWLVLTGLCIAAGSASLVWLLLSNAVVVV